MISISIRADGLPLPVPPICERCSHITKKDTKDMLLKIINDSEWLLQSFSFEGNTITYDLRQRYKGE